MTQNCGDGSKQPFVGFNYRDGDEVVLVDLINDLFLVRVYVDRNDVLGHDVAELVVSA